MLLIHQQTVTRRRHGFCILQTGGNCCQFHAEINLKCRNGRTTSQWKETNDLINDPLIEQTRPTIIQKMLLPWESVYVDMARRAIASWRLAYCVICTADDYFSEGVGRGGGVSRQN